MHSIDQYTLTIDGQDYIAQTLIVTDHFENERYILGLKPSPLEAVEKLPPLPPAPKSPDRVAGETAEEREAKVKAWRQQDREHKQLVAERQKLIDRAFEMAMRPAVVSPEDERTFANSSHGWAYRLWKCLRPNHPELTISDVAGLMETGTVQQGQEFFFDVIDTISKCEQEHLLKNCNGRKQPANQDESSGLNFHGGGSTLTSAGCTSGDQMSLETSPGTTH